MMPVVKGAPSTRRQILLYSLVLAPLALAPAFTGLGGRLYLAVAARRRGWRSWPWPCAWSQPRGRRAATGADGLYDVGRREAARDLFAFSILYLFALFAALLVERLADAPATLAPVGADAMSDPSTRTRRRPGPAAGATSPSPWRSSPSWSSSS